MTERIVFVTTMKIHEGKLDAFKEGVAKSMEFLRTQGPQVMAGVYLDEATMRAHGVQVHRDSASILTHFRLADEHMRNIMQHATTERVDLFGRPSSEVGHRSDEKGRSGKHPDGDFEVCRLRTPCCPTGQRQR